jgi:methanogenic corrinoid protein MtbC1
MSVADEHLVSAALRRILGGLIRLRTVSSSASLLLTTPPGEQHALGLTLVALLAVERGVKIYLLGPDLPASEIAEAAARAGVAAVGLSVVNSNNRQNAVEQTRQVEQLLPPDIELWLGGRDAQHLAEQLGPTRALILDRPDDIQVHLNRLRDQPGPAVP